MSIDSNRDSQLDSHRPLIDGLESIEANVEAEA